MNRILLIFLLLLTWDSSPSIERGESPGIYIRNGMGDAVQFRMIVIDGCEYLYHESYRKMILTHKGNCSNHLWLSVTMNILRL